MFAKSGGQLAGSGAVAWQFEPRGLITVPRDGVDADEVALAAIDAGAEDVDTDDDETIEIYTAPGDARSACARRSRARACRSSRPSRRWSPSRPSSSTRPRRARRCGWSSCSRTSTTSQRVTANFDIPEEVFAEVAG